MPTYQFRCPDGTIIERVFKISEAPEAIPLPDGQGVATRIISGGAELIFKGSGFYITDYGKDGKKALREQVAADARHSERTKGGDGSATERPKADASKPTGGSERGSGADKPAPAASSSKSHSSTDTSS